MKEWSFVMMAYGVSVPDITGYMPNFLTLGTEVRVPLDIILGLPIDRQAYGRVTEILSPTNNEHMRCAYGTVS